MRDLFSQTLLAHTAVTFLALIIFFVSIPVSIFAAFNTENRPEKCFFIDDYMRRDFNNDPVEVLKLQAFLINFEGHSNVSLTGVFDQATFDAVFLFQAKYSSDILEPWGNIKPTGYAYILTIKKINETYCQRIFPLEQAQLNEIIAHRALLESLTDTSTTTPSILPIVGEAEPSQGQDLRNNLAAVYKSDWRYFVLPLLIALLVFVFLAMSPSKRNSVRASIKSWYLVGSARVKSMLKEMKEVPKETTSFKEEPIRWSIKKEPVKPIEEEIVKETEVIFIEPKK